MLLTITYKGENTQNLGYLLHKNPARPQEVQLNYGKAYIFYPEVSNSITTAALLLDIDPIDLARGKVGSSGGGLFDYVNDRPYVSSSFMSTAISKVFGTAMTGRSKERQELADMPLELTAEIHMLPVMNKGMVTEIFEPLGYTVQTTNYQNDANFPEWGESRYITLTITSNVLLHNLLNHLYVLIPIFDSVKHYYVSEAEIEKLLSHGEGWLRDHPKCEYITTRYLNRRRSFINRVLEQLSDEPKAENESSDVETNNIEAPIKKSNLNQSRLQAVLTEVKNCGSTSVIDMGCGEGNLLKLLLKEKQISRISATDVSFATLEKLRDKIKLDRLHETLQNKLSIFQSSLTYRDKRFEGFDCACIVEVIEHMDVNRLHAFERILFEYSRPKTAIITTPNIEYNINYAKMEIDSLRHGDHRFEWTRSEFISWAESIAEQYDYTVVFKDVGDIDEENGTPTQMGIFSLKGH